MDNRVSHKKQKMTDIDLSKPLDINIIGSKDDPCFGKHHSLTASECRVCGDSEVCSIITGQLVNSAKRSKAHREGRFKDLEEADLITLQNTTIALAIKKLCEDEPGKILRVSKRVARKLEIDIDQARLLTKSFVARNKDLYKYDKQNKTIQIR